MAGERLSCRPLRRDGPATPQQIRHAIELASRLIRDLGWGVYERKGNGWQGAEVTWKEHDEGTVVWMHGGAFAFGPRVYRAVAVHLARVSRCRVVLPVSLGARACVSSRPVMHTTR